jgi:hypothetical protein
MTTRPRFMRPHSIGPRSIGPIGSWVPYTMSPFVMIGPIFILCFFNGLIEHVWICSDLNQVSAEHCTANTVHSQKNFNFFINGQAIKTIIHLSHFDVKIVL